MHTRFIELAGEINTFMPTYVVQRTANALNTTGKAIKGSKVLVLGLAYKKNIDDLRESPSLSIIKLLKKDGADVFYSDPYFPKLPKLRNYNYEMKSIEISEFNLKKYDAVILATDHDLFDYDFIHKNSNLIIDTRGNIKNAKKL